MKYKLVKPELNSYELSRLNWYASYVGYIFRMNIEKMSFLFEADDKNVGYIQKDEYGKIFLVWKFDESIQYIDDMIDVCMNMNKHNLITETLDRIKMIFGMNTICNYPITDEIREYTFKDKSWKKQ